MIATTPQQKVDLLSSTFEKNFNVSATPLTQGDVLPAPIGVCPTDLLCSEDDIIRLLLTLDTTKATGLDGISATMLKKTAAAAASLLTHLCNMSTIHGTVPEHWKTSMVVPIYK